MPLQESLRTQLLRVLIHPVSLILADLISFVLWMPFGFGYYDFPWKQPLAVFLLLAFVIGVPAFSAIGIARASRPQFLILRFIVSAVSLFIGLHGLVHMLHWWLYVSQKY